MSKTRDMALLAAGAALAPRGTQRVYERREIHEHRAPTDESVKLLKEMEVKAEAKLLAVLPLENNLFNGTIVIDRLASDMTLRARAIFTLNGHRMVVTETAYEGAKEREELMRKLHEAISTKIATEVLLDGVRALRW